MRQAMLASSDFALRDAFLQVVREKDAQIHTLKSTIKSCERENQNLKQVLERKSDEIDYLETKLSDRKTKYKNEIDHLEYELEKKGDLIKELKREVYKLKNGVSFPHKNNVFLKQLISAYVNHAKDKKVIVAKIGSYDGRVNIYPDKGKYYFSILLFFSPDEEREMRHIADFFRIYDYKIYYNTLLESEVDKNNEINSSKLDPDHETDSFTKLTIKDMTEMQSTEDVCDAIDRFLSAKEKYLNEKKETMYRHEFDEPPTKRHRM